MPIMASSSTTSRRIAAYLTAEVGWGMGKAGGQFIGLS